MSLEIKRKKTRHVNIGRVKVGDMAPVAVQSMTNTKTRDIAATVSQILTLEEAGCEIVRVAVPDLESASAVTEIKKEISIPVIADVHFDHKLAMASARAGADALRINPGNIGAQENVRAVADCAGDHGIPIRIGVNSGSLDKTVLKRYKGANAEAMVESALKLIDFFDAMGFNMIKISLKASDVPRTVAAYRLFSSRCDLPLHVGVTEAGPLVPGLVKSSLGIGMLLAEGIGDTIRVSLSAPPEVEVRAGYEILKALNIRRRGPEIVSCPTCGRCDIDLLGILDAVEKALMNKKTDIKVAVMGCAVNGPGEAREADVGIAGGKGVGILFKKGRVVKKFSQDKLVEVLLREIG